MKRLLIAFCLAATMSAAGPLEVVCTLTDLGWLAAEVGGDDVTVSVLCPGEYDPHFLPPRPSLARKLGKADLLCYNGLELEVGWLPVLVDKARNPRVRAGQPGSLDCADALETILEVPERAISRAQGDVHPFGNPHYLLDPRNGLRVAWLMAARFGELKPEAADRFRERARELEARLTPRIEAWHAAAAPARARPLVHYAKQWEYLEAWLELECLGAVEHRPGISPSPRHVDELVDRARAVGVRELLAAPWNHLDVAQKAADRMDATMVILPAAVGSQEGADSYPAMFDLIVERLAAAAEAP